MHEPKKAYTHGGIFHADDVFAAAALQMVYPSIEIVRVNTVHEIPNGALAFDFGGGKYDHHQKETMETRENGIPYSSFGKIWRDFGNCIALNPRIAEYVDKALVQGIDLQDCRGGMVIDVNGSTVLRRNELSNAIHAFNPNWNETKDPDQSEFKDAVNFARAIIRRYMAKAHATIVSEDTVIEAERHRKPGERFLVLPKYVNYNGFVEEGVVWVCYPSLRGGYQIFVVSDKNHNNKDSLTDMYDELKNDPHCTFVHPAGFTAVFDTEQAAIEFLRKRSEMLNALEYIIH